MENNKPPETSPLADEKPSAALFTAILEKAGHPKSKRAAEHIKQACDYLDDKGMEITVAEIGHFCTNSGPKTQSIHNNKDFCAYIKTRHAEQKLAVKPNDAGVKFESNDPQANAVIYALQVSKRRLEQMLHNLKGALADAGDYDLESTMRTGRLVRLADDPAATVSPELLDLVRRLLDPAHLIKFGFRIQQDRIIAVDRNNRVFMEKADLQRLMALIQIRTKAFPESSAPEQLADSPDGEAKKG